MPVSDFYQVVISNFSVLQKSRPVKLSTLFGLLVLRIRQNLAVTILRSEIRVEIEL